VGRDVRYQPFKLGSGGQQRNVLCGPKTSERGMILVCAHYDSVSESASQSAPGADDDASGIAALLELARVLRGVTLKRDVLFAAFGGEEQGLFGSAACAEIAARDKWPIDVVINMDMIGYKAAGSAPRITVEYDHGNRNPGNDAAAKAYGLAHGTGRSRLHVTRAGPHRHLEQRLHALRSEGVRVYRCL
jgi:Zn-dependent M28 family amino/carboxypeptidase